MVAKAYNLFISHAWSYGNAYDLLIGLLNKATNFSYRNYSIPKHDPVHTNGTDKHLYEAIKNKITGTHVVVIMAGKYATYSKWIIQEVKIAQTEFLFPKPILAVTPWGAQHISSVVKGAANEIVGWNTSSIVGGIRRLA
jgi:hypothetical protein